MTSREQLADTWRTLLGIGQAAAMLPKMSRAADGSIPLTVISGFLGSGKTTLLNNLLRRPGGARIAVLVNDFGAVNIDAELISQQTADKISLTNGCVCCSIAHSFTRALVDLSEQDHPPDAVVLEASGVSDPRSIVQIALMHRALQLNGVITVVSADAISGQIANAEYGKLLTHQIEAADFLLLNKASLVTGSQLDNVRTLMAALAPGRLMVEADYADVPTAVILGTREHFRDAVERSDLQDHREMFTTCELAFDEPIEERALRCFLDSLPLSLLRAKGVVRLASSSEHQHLLQVVGRRWTLQPVFPPLAISGTRLVFIGLGRSFDVQALRAQLAAFA